MSDWRHGVLDMLGAKPTPGNLRFLSNWQRWEGGHTKNSARYNWLNTTIDYPGTTGSINDVGVKAFDSRRTGIAATAATLLNGRYNDIVEALRAGTPYKYDLSAGLSTWVSGSPTGNLEYARKVMGGTGAPKASLPQGGSGGAGNPPLAPVLPKTDLWDIIFDDDPEFVSLLRSFPPITQPGEGPELEAGAQYPVTYSGETLVLPTKWKSTHPTSGLEKQGFRTAVDIMGSAGTPVGAMEDGVVLRWDPTGAQGGGSMWFRGASGRVYWIGHIANGLAPGTRVKRGQVIAAISPDHPRPHVHLDRRG